MSTASGCICHQAIWNIGTIQDYNNEIVIATDAQDLRLNDGINTKPVPPKQTHNVQGTLTSAPKVRALTQTPSQVIAQRLEQMLTHIAVSQPAQVQVSQQATQQKKALHEEHENNKTALIFGAIVLGTAPALYKKF